MVQPGTKVHIKVTCLLQEMQIQKEFKSSKGWVALDFCHDSETSSKVGFLSLPLAPLLAAPCATTTIWQKLKIINRGRPDGCPRLVSDSRCATPGANTFPWIFQPLPLPGQQGRTAWHSGPGVDTRVVDHHFGRSLKQVGAALQLHDAQGGLHIFLAEAGSAHFVLLHILFLLNKRYSSIRR